MRQWRNTMFSVVSSTYSERCPDFRTLVLLSQEPSVYLTGVGGSIAWILNAFIESDPFSVVAVTYREKILLVAFSFLTVSSEMQIILNSSPGIQMLMSNYTLGAQPPSLPLLGRSYTSFDPQPYVDQWHPDVSSDRTSCMLQRNSCSATFQFGKEKYSPAYHPGKTAEYCHMQYVSSSL